MAESGTVSFASSDDYCAAMRAGAVNLTLTRGGNFNARLSWLNLGHLQVLHGYENLPRIGFFSLSSEPSFVLFPTNAGAPLIYDGIGLQFGDVVFHSRGERMHQRTDGEGAWGLISLSPEWFAACSAALTGMSIASPSEGRVLRPPTSTARLRLGRYSRICRLPQTKPHRAGNPDIARALHQEVGPAVLDCLT